MPTPRKYATAAQRQAAYRQRHQARQQAGLAANFPSQPGRRRWQAMGAQALGLLIAVAAEMEHYYQARTQAWQDSERGEAFG
jgi:hypothetical protein